MRCFKCAAVLALAFATSVAFAKSSRCRRAVCESPPDCCISPANVLKPVVVCANPRPAPVVSRRDLVSKIANSETETANAIQSNERSGDEKPATELDQILADWEKAASRVRRLDCEFTRFKYDHTFEIETHGEGNIALEGPRQARYRLVPSPIAGIVARKMAQNGQPFGLKADSPVSWHWTGTQVISVDETERTFQAVPMPADFESDSLWLGIEPLFGLSPFLVAMSAKRSKSDSPSRSIIAVRTKFGCK
jgi:hypothetical protein